MAAQEVVKAIVAKVPSAKASISYTDVTDPNHLLGRPNGYLSKSTFVDNRVPNDNTASSLGDVKVGGSVEVFSDAAGALGRKTYLGNVAKIFSTVVEYDYVSGPVLLRVTPMLTPSEAEEYGAALSSLSGK
jgi:hypothetical protein